ncbi:hypothetical protein EC951288_2850A, partial [Escherichia coli 95.1288]
MLNTDFRVQNYRYLYLTALQFH